MNVKLITLKSGEDIVSELQEMIVNEKLVGYYFRNPCRVSLFGEKSEHQGSVPAPFKMQLIPWMPLSKDEIIPVVADWVVTIVEPIDKLKEMYLKGVENYENRKLETSGSDERSDSSDAN